MNKGLRIGLGIVGVMAVLAVVQVPTAQADGGFSGTFRGPHGQFSIHVGSPSYPAGSWAPYGHRVYRRPSYGYGFDSPAFDCRPHRTRHAHWVPVRRHHSRWLVVEQPVVVVERPYYEPEAYGYGDRGYYENRGSDDRYYDERRYDDRRYDDRRYDERYRDDRGWRGGDRRYSYKEKRKSHRHSHYCDHDDD